MMIDQMQQYHDLVSLILNNGEERSDRTGVGTYSIFSPPQLSFDLNKFPILTTKEIHFKSIVVELFWFLNGRTDLRYLVQNGCNIWNEWPYEKYVKYCQLPNINIQPKSLKEYLKEIESNPTFEKVFGHVENAYGMQWRKFGQSHFDSQYDSEIESNLKQTDQIKHIINEINTNPNSRRLVVTSMNPTLLWSNQYTLPPCHVMFQFYVSTNKELSCHMYQRSADVFLGLPFNITSYALLTRIMAHCTNLKPGKLHISLGDAHIYKNHEPVCRKILSRNHLPCPVLVLNSEITNFDTFIQNFENVQLLNYLHHEKLKAPVAI